MQSGRSSARTDIGAGALFSAFFLTASTLWFAQQALADPVLYSVTYSNGMINAQDPDTGALLNSFAPPIPVQPGGGIGLAASDSELFYCAIESSLIFRLNPSTGALLDSYFEPFPATEPQIDSLGYGASSFGPTLFAGDYAADRIYLLNPATGNVFTSYLTPYDLVGGMDFDPATNRLWTSDITGVVYSTNPETGAVISSLPTTGGAFGIGLVDGRLFTGIGSIIVERDKTTGAVINSFSSASGANLAALAGVPEPATPALLALLVPALTCRRPRRAQPKVKGNIP
jgi:hypothetical protein